MYRQRKFISIVVSLLLLYLNIFTACNNNAGAQNGEPDGEPDIANQFVHVYGFMFNSRMDDGSGEFQSGTFQLEEFLSEDGNLLARGILKGASNPSGTQVTLPVKITASTCNVLQMEIGPPEGLLDPIHVVLHEPLTSFDHQDLCAITSANISGDNDLLVDMLNEEGVLLGCTAYQAAMCGVAIGLCAASCSVTAGLACGFCLAGLGASACLDCILD
jgi:hypothetical protein